eukprot:gene1222-2375_t
MERLSNPIHARLLKVLYIEAGVDSKGSAILLENGTQSHGVLATFTVVSSAFTGIDCTEHTSYDIIFVEDCNDGFGAADFVGLLRTIGNPVPVVLLVGIEDDINDDHIRSFGFSGVLRKPFSPKSLCRVIHTIMQQQNAQQFSGMMFCNTQEFKYPTRCSISPSVLPNEKGMTTYEESNTMRPVAPAIDGWDDEREVMLLFEEHMGDTMNHSVHSLNQDRNRSIYDINNNYPQDSPINGTEIANYICI